MYSRHAGARTLHFLLKNNISLKHSAYILYYPSANLATEQFSNVDVSKPWWLSRVAIPAGDNYDKKRENNKKKEIMVEKCGGN